MKGNLATLQPSLEPSTGSPSARQHAFRVLLPSAVFTAAAAPACFCGALILLPASYVGLFVTLLIAMPVIFALVWLISTSSSWFAQRMGWPFNRWWPALGCSAISALLFVAIATTEVVSRNRTAWQTSRCDCRLASQTYLRTVPDETFVCISGIAGEIRQSAAPGWWYFFLEGGFTAGPELSGRIDVFKVSVYGDPSDRARAGQAVDVNAWLDIPSPPPSVFDPTLLVNSPGDIQHCE
jgi:hypothetical protein